MSSAWSMLSRTVFIQLTKSTGKLLLSHCPAHSCQNIRRGLRHLHIGGSVCRQFESQNGGKFKVSAVVRKYLKLFECNSVDEPKESIENIVAHCLGSREISVVHKFKDRILTEAEMEKITTMCQKRLNKVPIQYIIGEWDFRGLTLKMQSPVFIPRPETEDLVELVLRDLDQNSAAHVLDLCCGSGAICLSLLHERPLLNATALDRSLAACRLTKENAQKNGLAGNLHVILGSLGEDDEVPLGGPYDLIVSNPPYVFTEDMSQIQDDIKLYEDLRALDGGKDGLDFIRIILNKAANGGLVENGKLYLEVDPRHPSMIRAMASELGLKYLNAHKDFCGKLRFVEIVK